MTNVQPESFGAKGDGAADDTAALNAAVAVLAPGDNLQLRGTYRHGSVLTVAKDGVRMGGGGRLVGTNSAACALVIAAHDVTVEDLRLSVVTTVRQSNDESAALLVGPSGPVKGFRARRLHLDGSGVMVRGRSHDFVLEDVQVTNSLADGIHLTDGVHDGLVLRPTVLHSGDDGVAVVSYLSNSTPCRDIQIRSPRVRDVYHGRGVSVVGGTRVGIFDIDVSQTSGAAVYVACEDNVDWRTYAPRQITVRGGLVTAANITSPQPEHGAVLVVNESSDRPIEAVDISGLVIRDTHAIFYAIGYLGSRGGGHTGCTLSDIVIAGSCPRLVTLINGGTVAVRNVRVGVTNFVPHPSEAWLTNPNGRISGAHGSTAVLLDGSYWYKMTTGDMTGWQRLGGMRR